MAAMKWWGWGQEGIAFSHEDKPALRDFIRDAVQVDVDAVPPTRPPIGLDALDVPPTQLPDALREALADAVGADHVSVDDLDRVVHLRGKSLRDLVRTRRGDLGRVPDVVVRPADEDQVVAVLDAVLAADAVLIPFGGGTNISGSLDAPAGEERAIVSVDVRAWIASWRSTPPRGSRGCRPASTAPSSSASSTPRGGRPATSPTRSRTRRWAAGSPPAPAGCSPTSTATSPT